MAGRGVFLGEWSVAIRCGLSSSIGGPLLSLAGPGGTASLALRCCGYSIAEPSLSLASRRAQHRRPIDAVSGGRLPVMSGLPKAARPAGRDQRTYGADIMIGWP